MTMADTIAGKLKQALSPREIDVRDVSHQHAGHSGWREGGETHFEVVLRADRFAGMSRVQDTGLSTASLPRSLPAGCTRCSSIWLNDPEIDHAGIDGSIVDGVGNAAVGKRAGPFVTPCRRGFEAGLANRRAGLRASSP